MQSITTGRQTLTAAGVVTGTLDTSALTTFEGISINVSALTAGAVARVSIEDTANSSEFSDALPVAVFDFSGPVGGTDVDAADVQKYIEKQELASLRWGATHNQLRANVLILSGSSPSITIQAELQ